MTELEKLCEEALFEEVKALEDGRSIVRDNASGYFFYRKRLSVYNPDVFAWLKDHKSRYVPRIEAFWQDQDELVVIEELIQGETLEKMLEESESGNEMPFHERIRILTELCDGLTFLHSAKPPIIHRDLKPSNIMLTEDGVVKIIDYDAAKLFVKGQKRDTQLIGTQGMAAPEQYGFAASDARTDIYAMGKLVTRMLPDNEDAARVAARATHMDPARRFASAAQLKDAIRRIREKRSSLDPLLQKIPGYDPVNKRHRILARVAIPLLCCLVVFSAYSGYRRLIAEPKERQAAMAAELQTLSEFFAQAGEIARRSKLVLQMWPYEKMTDEQKKQFRGIAETMICKCTSDDTGELQDTGLYLGQAALTYLSEIQDLGVDARTAEEIAVSGQIQYLIYENRWDEALAIRKYLKGMPDEAEELEAVTKACVEKSEKWTRNFQQLPTLHNAESGLKFFSQLVRADYEGAETLFRTYYESVLACADAKKDEGAYNEAIKFYEILADYEAPGETAVAEKTLEVDYLKAQQAASKELYDEAADLFANIPGYKEADQKRLDAEYSYCTLVQETPDEKAYSYLDHLLSENYSGAEELRDIMSTWHARIETGMGYLVGAEQAAMIRIRISGGTRDGTHVRLVITRQANGESRSWTSEEVFKNGEYCETTIQISSLEEKLFEETYIVEVYADDGTLMASITGPFSMGFLQDLSES